MSIIMVLGLGFREEIKIRRRDMLRVWYCFIGFV